MSGPTTIADVELRQLGGGFTGDVILPADGSYDSARRVWNGMVDRSPAVIARCASVADVVAAVRFARARSLAVAVRGGGHNAAGLAVCDGGMVVDLTRLKDVRVDPGARLAEVGAGVTWGELDVATQAHGLATTGGAISTTGIAGLTLGGGIGWLMRSVGLACDNLVAAELVTADGEVVRASETENAELLWGLRGGGGNFGIVTRFDYRLHPVGPMVLGGMFMHPFDRAREALRFYRDFTRDAPDALTTFAALLHTPDGTPMVAFPVCWNGPLEEGERAVRPLREFGPPVVDQVGPLPYVALQTMLDPGFPAGLQVYWRGEFLSGVSDELIDEVVRRYERVTSPLTAVLFEQMGGAVARVPRDATAFDHREAAYNLAIVSRWPEPSGADVHIGWTRELSEAMRPFGSGVYVNYIGYGESADRVRSAYGAEKYERLVALKRRWDPANFFRMNQNVSPD